jgi:hypothetical protein
MSELSLCDVSTGSSSPVMTVTRPKSGCIPFGLHSRGRAAGQDTVHVPLCTVACT